MGLVQNKERTTKSLTTNMSRTHGSGVAVTHRRTRSGRER